MIRTFGIALAQLLQQRRPVHLRHDDVGHHEIDLAAVALELLQRLDAVAGLDHRIAARRESAGIEHAQPLLVLDQQDGALAGEIGARRCEPCRRPPRCAPAIAGAVVSGSFGVSMSSAAGMWRGRKIRKIVPFFSSELDIDEAAGLLDDAVDGREPEPGALADVLGGVEGVENLVDDLGRDAGAGVLDLDQHVFAERQPLVLVAGALLGA